MDVFIYISPLSSQTTQCLFFVLNENSEKLEAPDQKKVQVDAQSHAQQPEQGREQGREEEQEATSFPLPF